MPILTFNGTVTQNIFSSGIVGGTAPDQMPVPTNGTTFATSVTGQPITWQGTPPPNSVVNLRPYQLANYAYQNPIVTELRISPSIVIVAGQQSWQNFSYPTSYIGLQYYSNSSVSGWNYDTITPPSSGNSGVATYNNNIALYVDIPLDQVGPLFSGSINIYNQCYPGLPSCKDYAATGFTMNIVVNVTLQFSCLGENIDTQFCSDYCTQLVNQGTCYPDYRDYCLKETDNSGDIKIFGSTGCYSFFTDYISETGPQEEVDFLLTTACTQKFPLNTLLNDFNASPSQTQNVCSCHLNPEFYVNLQTALNTEFPGSILIKEPAPCLFNPCVNYGLKSTSTGKVCPLPACVNIAAINNNGTITGGGAIINQKDENCANISKPGSANDGGGSSNPEISWIEKNWVWLVIGISILVVLIIVIIIFISAESSKKKKPAKR